MCVHIYTHTRICSIMILKQRFYVYIIYNIWYNNSRTKIINPISNIQSKVAWYRDVICVTVSNKAL